MGHRTAHSAWPHSKCWLRKHGEMQVRTCGIPCTAAIADELSSCHAVTLADDVAGKMSGECRKIIVVVDNDIFSIRAAGTVAILVPYCRYYAVF